MPRKLQIRQDDVNLPVDLATAKRAKYAVATTSVALAASSGVDSLGNAYRPNDKVITLSDGATKVGIAESQVALSTNTLTVATVNALPATPQRPNYFVSSNRLVYAVTVDGYVTNGVSYVSTDAEWAAMTQMIDGQIVHHRGRGATYTYDKPTASWSWRSGSTSKPKTGIIDTLTARAMYCLDSRAGQEITRTVNGTARLADHSQRGDVRQMRTGGCLALNGTSEYAGVAGSKPILPLLGKTYTMAAWVKFTAEGRAILAEGGGSPGGWHWAYYHTYLQFFSKQNGAAIAFDLRSTTFPSLSGTGWHHVALRIVMAANGDTADALFYLDGIELGQNAVTTTGNYADGDHALTVGARDGGVTLFAAGSLADVRIFDKALTPTQIKDLAALAPGSYRGVDGLPVPLLAYDFEDPTLSPFCRNKGSLGAKGDLTITTGSLATVRGSTFPGYCFANEFGYSPSFVTNGSSHYIDTGLPFSNSTAFTVWRRARYLATAGFDLDGFWNDGGEAMRLGRDNSNNQLYVNLGDQIADTPGITIPNNEIHSICIQSSTTGNEKIWFNGALIKDAASSMAAFTGQNITYKIGCQHSTAGGPSHFGQVEYYEYLLAQRVLTSDEIKWLDTKGQAGTPIDFLNDPDILLYYDFKDQHPTLVRNLADPSNPGRIVGGQWGAVQQSYSAGQDVDQVDYSYGRAVYIAKNTVGTLDFGTALIPATAEFDISIDFNIFSVDDVDTFQTILSQFKTSGTEGRAFLRVSKASLYLDWFVGAADPVDTNMQLKSADNTIVIGKWHRARMTKVGSLFSLYLDGQLVATQDLPDAVIDTSSNTFLGQGEESLSTHNEFHGLISNIAINGKTFLTEPDETIPGATLTNASYVNVVRGKPGTLGFKGRAPRDPIVNSPCVTLNGTSESITLPIDLSSPSSWSFACRVKTTGSLESIMDARDANDDGFRILWNAGNLAVSSDATDLLFASDDFDDGEWHYLEVDWDGATATAKLDGITIGSGAISAPSSVTRTNVICGKFFDSSGGWLDGQIADIAMTVDGSVVGKWPLCDGAGKYALDVSGNGNHGEITGTLSAIWANTQPVFNYLTEAGWSPATWFDGANDSYSRSTLVGAADRLCIYARFILEEVGVSHVICSEYDSTGNDRSFQLSIRTDNRIQMNVSNDGLAPSPALSDSGTLVNANEWYDLFVQYDGTDGSVYFELNGVDISEYGTEFPMRSGNSDFYIGSNQAGGTFFKGVMHKLLIHKNPTQDWGSATRTAIRNASTDEVPAVVSGLGGTAWYFPAGDSNETLQNAGGWTTNGSPEPRYIPGGAGVPVTYQNQLAPTQSLSLDCGEADSPFALKFAGILSDLTYNQGDGSEAAHWFVRTPEDADDRLQLFESALSGFDLSAITFDLNN